MTVIAALLCRTLADVNGTSGLGPIGALGIAVAMLAMLTLLPAWARDLRSHRLLAARARVRHEGTDELHGRPIVSSSASRSCMLVAPPTLASTSRSTPSLASGAIHTTPGA